LCEWVFVRGEGEEEIWWWRVMPFPCRAVYLVRSPSPLLMVHEKNREREKRTDWQFVRCLFVFKRHFSLKYLIEFIFNFCIFVSFFYSVVLRNWPWATALYSAPNPITLIITTTPRR
jgi:hypothetical protein